MVMNEETLRAKHMKATAALKTLQEALQNRESIAAIAHYTSIDREQVYRTYYDSL